MTFGSILLVVLANCARATLNDSAPLAQVSGAASAETAMDIILRVNQNARIPDDRERLLVDSDMVFNVSTSHDTHNIHQDVFHAAVRNPNRLWSGAVVPYKIAYDFQKSKVAMGIIRASMREWETKTCIRFVVRTDQVDFVEFKPGKGCLSDVGRKGGRQEVTLDIGCMYFSVIVHEIGHVIGFWHEQNRPDRDRYVRIHYENIDKSYHYAFEVHRSKVHSMDVPYDYQSIMHYGANAFSSNGLPTITANRTNLTVLGNVELSPLDILQTNLLYRCDSLFSRGWTSWSSWSECSHSCGRGSMERRRTCTHVSGGLSKCSGPSTERQACNQHQCPEWPIWPRDFSFYGDTRLRPAERCVMIFERNSLAFTPPSQFCTNKTSRDPGIKWSDQGQVAGMQCTQVNEPSDPNSLAWSDSYICVPMDAPYRLKWSHDGKIPGMGCIQWLHKGGVYGWNNNFLCGTNVQIAALQSASDRSSHLIVHGGWSKWTFWTNCSKTCDGGERYRFRICSKPVPQNGGKFCYGSHTERQSCNVKPCTKTVTDCGGPINGTSGEFFSPGYPINYPNEVNCVWSITVSGQNKIMLMFTTFHIEGPQRDSSVCSRDVITVYDGTVGNSSVFGHFCDTKRPGPFISSGNRISVLLRTDATVSYSGFRASWRTIDILGESVACGGVLTKAPGSISSPNYPQLYPPNALCEWTIKAPENQVILFSFENLSIEEQQTCRFDKLELHEEVGGSLHHIGKFCGNISPSPITTLGNVLVVKFSSDFTFHFPGFKANFVFKNKSVKITEFKVCPESWITFTDTDQHTSCYILKPNYYTWFLAKDDCMSNGGDLASINSLQEQTFLQTAFVRNSYVWIGFTDKDTEGRWAWNDGSPVGYVNWDGGDPNNGGHLQNEDCAIMKFDGKWNDYPCTTRFHYICEVQSGDLIGTEGPNADALTRFIRSRRTQRRVRV